MANRRAGRVSEIDTAGAGLALQKLVGLQLAEISSIVDVRSFGFRSQVEQHSANNELSYALDLHCAWRIEAGETLMTGRADFFERATDNRDETWQPGDVWGNVQDEMLTELLGLYDRGRRVVINSGLGLVVTSVLIDPFGGFQMDLSHGLRLAVFPDGGRDEKWSLLSLTTDYRFVLV